MIHFTLHQTKQMTNVPQIPKQSPQRRLNDDGAGEIQH